jgi:hypothetical protein
VTASFKAKKKKEVGNVKLNVNALISTLKANKEKIGDSHLNELKADALKTTTIKDWIIFVRDLVVEQQSFRLFDEYIMTLTVMINRCNFAFVYLMGSLARALDSKNSDNGSIPSNSQRRPHGRFRRLCLISLTVCICNNIYALVIFMNNYKRNTKLIPPKKTNVDTVIQLFEDLLNFFQIQTPIHVENGRPFAFDIEKAFVKLFNLQITELHLIYGGKTDPVDEEKEPKHLIVSEIGEGSSFAPLELIIF